MVDVFLQPVMDMVNKLGINKTANVSPQGQPETLTDDQLAKELGKLAGDMPEDLAGQKMDDDKTPMSTPEKTPAAPVLENSMDGKPRWGTRTEDNLDSLTQTPAPLSNPGDLDTNQDPLARMAEKIACVIEPLLEGVDSSMQDSAQWLSRQITKEASPISGLFNVAKKNPGSTAAMLGTGLALGGGLGFFGGKRYERKKDDKEDSAIFDLGAQVGGQVAANEILSRLNAAADNENKGGEQ